MDRVDLHNLLIEILGSHQVYFQPPATVDMSYPAIVYSRTNIENTCADNAPYIQSRSYKVTVIDKNPDSEIVDKVAILPNCRYDRNYKSENLNHDVFIITI